MSTTAQVLSAEEAALHRRSIRKYSDTPVTEETLHHLLELAGRAPSAWNLQPWRVHVVHRQELKDKLMAAAYGQPQVGGASYDLVITSDMEDVLGRLPEIFGLSMDETTAKGYVDQVGGIFGSMPVEARAGWGRNQANIYIGYLLLLAETMGLATSPMLGFDPAAVKTLLGLPEHVEVAAIIAIGYAAEDGHPSKRHPLSVTVNHAG